MRRTFWGILRTRRAGTEDGHFDAAPRGGAARGDKGA